MKKLTKLLLIPMLCLTCGLILTACGGNSNNNGDSDKVPSAPRNFQAVAGDGEVTLTWETPENNFTEDAYYQTWDSNGNEWLDSFSFSTKTISGLTNGTEYTFKVRAVNSNGEGQEAEKTATPVSTRPSAPLNLTAESKDYGAMTLSWETPARNGESAITKYQVIYGYGSWVSSWRDVGLETTYTYTNLETNQGELTFRVRAVNDNGNGDESAAVNETPRARTAPSAPRELSAVAGDETITLNWLASADNGGLSVQYEISSDNETTWEWVTLGNLTHTFDELTNDKDYTFKVRASNTIGKSDAVEISAFPHNGELYTNTSGTINFTKYGKIENAKLANIEIPVTVNSATVTGISSKMFENFTALSDITIPSSVTTIANNAFLGCTNLTRVDFKGTELQWYKSGAQITSSVTVQYSEQLAFMELGTPVTVGQAGIDDEAWYKIKLDSTTQVAIVTTLSHNSMKTLYLYTQSSLVSGIGSNADLVITRSIPADTLFFLNIKTSSIGAADVEMIDLAKAPALTLGVGTEQLTLDNHGEWYKVELAAGSHSIKVTLDQAGSYVSNGTTYYYSINAYIFSASAITQLANTYSQNLGSTVPASFEITTNGTYYVWVRGATVKGTLEIS